MKAASIIFSPTGGTKRVSNILTEEWGMPVHEIDLTDAKIGATTLQLDQDDFAVIAVPSYGGRVPALAAQRLSNIHCNQTPCVIVCVYGNRAYEDTLIELYDIANQSGFVVIAAIAAVAEHSIMHQYATGRPDATDDQELRDYAKQILEKVKQKSSEEKPLGFPGNRPYKEAGGASLIPKANNTCTGCGICAQQCPAQAISKEQTKITDSDKCISCMRCVAICPQKARKVNRGMVSIAALAMKKVCSVRKGNELYI